jgi:DHA1 family bicyclomycin/chloramphenicol resistance-like MFS transporter
MCIFSVGFAICYPVIFGESLNVFPAMRGTAASAIMGLRALLVSLFTGLTGYLYNGEPVMVSACILLGVFLAFVFAMGMVSSGRFLPQAPQTANAS